MANRKDYTSHYESPLGGITLASDGHALTGLWFDGQQYYGSTLGGEPEQQALEVFDQTAVWLDLYFAGREPIVTPPISLRGTIFRRTIWEMLPTIPYGRTMTYGEIAERIARQKGVPHMSAQAVGGAVAHNPISLIVPCHRVIGANGSLTGYAGGISRKLALLQLEGVNLPQ